MGEARLELFMSCFPAPYAPHTECWDYKHLPAFLALLTFFISIVDIVLD
jgi:hypothetical protein